MAVEAPAANQAPLLYRTEPFCSMESARRFQLLWQSRAVQSGRGESIFAAEQPPTHVLIIFEGHVSVFGELPAEPGPIMLDELGAGGCVGWNPALAGVPGVCAVATAEVNGLLVPAPAFLEITRYDPAIRKAIYSKPLKSEVWRAVLAEMERRIGGLRSARVIVDSLIKQAITRDWPEEESQIAADTDLVWVVVGGEGVQHGARWERGEGVLWARLIGLPELKLNEGLIAISALATVETEVSPSRSDESFLGAADKISSVSSSEVRQVSLEPSRSSIGRIDEKSTRADRVWTRVLAAFVIVILCTVAAIGWWASRQTVIRTISLPGRLSFTGETRPLKAAAAGTLVEFNLRAGERVRPGAILAVVRPVFDEGRWRELNASLVKAKRDAEFCESFLAGASLGEVSSDPALQALTREYARLQGEARVFTSIANGGIGVPGMTDAERQRVRQHFATITEGRAEHLDSVARDAATRSEDLRDAEQSLREALEEVRMHQQSFAGVTNEDKKEAAQELADYRRVLAVLNRQVAARQESVNRLKREINLLRAEATPVQAPAAPESGNDELAAVQAAVARIERQFADRAKEARQARSDAEAAIERFRVDVAPRQILARAPGLVTEASTLAIGTSVTSDTALAQLVTRETWQIECSIAPEQMAKLQPGQRIRVAYSDQAGKRCSAVEPLVLADGPTPRLRLHVTHEDWREGMPVQIETDVIMGSLLDQWLGRVSLTP